MGIFSLFKRKKQQIHPMHSITFQKDVAKAIASLSSWTNFLYKTNQGHASKFKEIDTALHRLEEKINYLAQLYYTINEIWARLDAIESRLKKEPEKHRTVRSRLLRKLHRKSKDYIKNLILALIQKYQKISASELKEIIVDEQGVCSKSTFYRLLQELEEESEDFDKIRKKKEKLFFSKTSIIK